MVMLFTTVLWTFQVVKFTISYFIFTPMGDILIYRQDRRLIDNLLKLLAKQLQNKT